MIGQIDNLPGVSIRSSTPDDAEGIWNCLAAVARERRYLSMVEPPSLEEVRHFSSSELVIQFVALAGALVVGWCDVARKPRHGFRHSAALGMGLLSAYRGRGIGSALLRSVVHEARSRGVSRIELEVYPSNKPAVALYQRFGFAYEGTKKAARVLDGKAEDITCMALLLPPLGGTLP